MPTETVIFDFRIKEDSPVKAMNRTVSAGTRKQRRKRVIKTTTEMAYKPTTNPPEKQRYKRTRKNLRALLSWEKSVFIVSEFPC